MTVPLYKRAYSKVSYYLFLWLHSSALIIHTISFLFVMRYIPDDEDYSFTLTSDNYILEGPKEYSGTTYASDKVQYNVTEVDFMIELGSTKQYFNNINPIRMIFFNELITALSHLTAVLLLIFQESVCINVENRAKGEETEENIYPRPIEYNRRWIEYAITAGSLEIALALTVGHHNVYILLSLLTLNAAQQMIGFVLDDLKYQELMLEIKSEKITNSTAGGWFQTFKLKFILMLVGFLCLFIQAFIITEGGSFRLKNTNANIDIEDDIQMVSIVYAILYSLFGFHMLFIHLGDCRPSTKKRRNCWLDLFDGDAMFIVLSCSVKVLLSWLIIALTYEMTNLVGKTNNSPYMGPSQDETDWRGARITYFVLCGFIFVIGSILTSLFTDSNLTCCYKMENGGRDKNDKTFREYCCSWSGVKNTLMKAEKAVLGGKRKKRVEYTTIKF